jgi:CheY-like chemotaxis protein
MTRKRSILVVDDDPDICEVLQIALECNDHHIRVAGSCNDALSIVESGWIPEIILLDYCMPGMAPEEFVEELIHKAPKNLPRIILMTAAGDANSRARRVGVPEVLRKPFDATQVFAQIDSV